MAFIFCRPPQMVRTYAEIQALLDGRGETPSASAIASLVPEGPLLLILILGSTNDAAGKPDGDVALRARLAVDLYRRACAAGRAALVLPSGGVAPGFSFNPTERPHWECVAAALEDAGLPAAALLRPGLPALHTVEEALLCRTLASHYSSRAGCGELQLLVLTSCFHAPRTRHLFGLCFGPHTALPLRCDVASVPTCWDASARAAREAHEAAALEALRTAPFGPWLDYLRAARIEAANRSRRWSRRLEPSPAELMSLAEGGAMAAAIGECGQAMEACDVSSAVPM